MRRLLCSLVCAICVWWVLPTLATAQVPTDSSQEVETRPATTTPFGDTGLWFVPTGEILPHGGWSVSGYRVNLDREQGFTDISHFSATFAVGLRDRVELFGSFRADTRIRRSVRPLFDPSLPAAGGLVNSYPLSRDGWSGDSVGDLLLGAKLNLSSEHRLQAAAFAVRGTVKLPTGDDDAGVSTGKADVYVDAILSKALNERVELSGFGGVVVRADPSGIKLSDGFRWGFGAAFPTHRAVRIFAEVNGEMTFDDTVTTAVPLTAGDRSSSPLVSPLRSPVDTTIGVVWQGAGGVFAGAGLSWAARHRERSAFGSAVGTQTGDTLGLQVRIGYHPGTRVYVPPPPPPPPPPANRPPTVTARCNPTTVQVGSPITCIADAQDPDGDSLTYRWSAPTGTFGLPVAQQASWTAPGQPGPVPISVTVTDGRGGSASDTVTVQVTSPPPPPTREFVFEDVHFDFDRYTLRPSAVQVLDEAVQALEENSSLQIEIEGHTCNIGTAEYNLALGERRANAVLEYLTSLGIGTDRLQTVSYGEERPLHDNAREETRRLNRRAALVVRVQ